jgi:hypothetical protein
VVLGLMCQPDSRPSNVSGCNGLNRMMLIQVLFRCVEISFRTKLGGLVQV